MGTTPYPRAIARFVASGLYRDYERSNEAKGLRQQIAPFELQWFQESLTDGSYRPEEQVVLVGHLTTGSGEPFFRRNAVAVALALKGATWVEPWVRLFFSAQQHRVLAWNARGHGYANEVTPEGWKKFHAEMGLSRKDLTEARQLRPDRPEIAEEMMHIVTTGEGGPGETIRLWFDRAVAAQMDYWPAYLGMLQYLRPRWHGSFEQMLAFGRECLETGRFDTQVPAFLFEIVSQIEADQAEEIGEKLAIYRRPEVFALLSRAVDGYLTADPAHRRWWESRYVLFAHWAGRDADALRHLEAAGFDPDPTTPGLAEKADHLAGKVCVFGGPGGQAVRDAEERYRRGESEGLLAVFEEAAAKAQRAEARRWLAHRIAGLSVERDLAAGKWVSFLPRSDDLAGWEVELGTWRLDKDGSLLGTSGAKGLMLNGAARVGPDFDIQGEVEFVKGLHEDYQAGIVFGHPTFATYDWLSFRIVVEPGGRAAYVSRHFSRPKRMTQIAPRNPSRFELRCQGGKVTAAVNGVEIERDYQPQEGLIRDDDLRVGFGGYLNTHAFAVRYRNVRLRRLGPSAGTPDKP